MANETHRNGAAIKQERDVRQTLGGVRKRTPRERAESLVINVGGRRFWAAKEAQKAVDHATRLGIRTALIERTVVITEVVRLSDIGHVDKPLGLYAA